MPPQQPGARPKKSFMRRLNIALWVAALFFFTGYGLTYLTRDLVRGPLVTMPAAALGAMWVGARVGRPLRSAAAGMGLGAIAGLGTAMVLVTLVQPRHDVPMLAALDAVSATGQGFVIRPVMIGMIAAGGAPLSPEDLREFIGKNMLATAGFCGLAATIMGLAAQRRKARVERQWGQ